MGRERGMKVIFLDIDGVLNNEYSKTRAPSGVIGIDGDKVKRLRQLITEKGCQTLIEVDGGVQGETAPRLVAAGVDVLVSGSYVFNAPDPKQVIHDLRSL